MSFKTDVDMQLQPGAFHRGLGALRAADRVHIGVNRPASLLGSADVDGALLPALPNAPRWDYLIGQSIGRGTHVHWIEIHPAGGGANIQEVEKKLAWLLGWLKDTCLASYPRDIAWVASGKSAFNARDPNLKRLANKGCRFAGGYIQL
jgi:hypothetical protein